MIESTHVAFYTKVPEDAYSIMGWHLVLVRMPISAVCSQCISSETIFYDTGTKLCTICSSKGIPPIPWAEL